jgi:hypothetical protein
VWPPGADAIESTALTSMNMSKPRPWLLVVLWPAPTGAVKKPFCLLGPFLCCPRWGSQARVAVEACRAARGHSTECHEPC